MTRPDESRTSDDTGKDGRVQGGGVPSRDTIQRPDGPDVRRRDGVQDRTERLTRHSSSSSPGISFRPPGGSGRPGHHATADRQLAKDSLSFFYGAPLLRSHLIAGPRIIPVTIPVGTTKGAS